MTDTQPPELADVPWWSLETLRSLDPVLGLALLMVLAVVLSELLRRRVRLPRACGQMLVGALASPLVLQLLDRKDLDPWKPLIDLAIALLVFELGSRIRPRWLIDNPWLALKCVLEGALAGLAVTGTMVWLGAPWLSAAAVGVVAMSTSPVIVLVVVHEERARGQVTERLLLMTAVNSVLAMLALNMWRVVAAAQQGPELVQVATDALYVVSGSFLLGTACALLLSLLGRHVRGTRTLPVLQIALVIAANMLATQWMLSPLLALLVAGVIARNRMRHALTVEPQFGSTGAILGVLLFISLGVLLTVDRLGELWFWVLAIILARLLGKGLAVGLLARPSGLGWRQAAALVLALQPMSSLTVLLAARTFDWTDQLPGADTATLQALLIAATLMQLTGPLWTSLALRHGAREAVLPEPKKSTP